MIDLSSRKIVNVCNNNEHDRKLDKVNYIWCTRTVLLERISRKYCIESCQDYATWLLMGCE